MPGEIINLNRFRKTRQRAAEEAKAEENRIRFGRTKAEKQKQAFERKVVTLHLDGHELEDDKP